MRVSSIKRIRDIEKTREYSRRFYEKNKTKAIADAKLSKTMSVERNKKYILDLLSTSKCIDCDESDPIVLEFDHVRGIKRSNVATLVSYGYGLKTIKDEIAKCEIRCANCHRRRTYFQFGYQSRT